MESFDPDAHAETVDIENMYRLALGRDPESDQVIAERLCQPNSEWILGFFKSEEFTEKVYDKVVSGRGITGGLFDSPPSLDLRKWAVSFLPLSQAGKAQIAEVADWYELMYHLFSDGGFIQHALGGESLALQELFVSELWQKHEQARSATVEGGVDAVVRGEICGWALDRADPDRRLVVELHANDILVSAASTSEYRNDLRILYGGNGWHGFRLRFEPDQLSRSGMRAFVKDSATGTTIFAFDLPAPEPPIDQIVLIKKEVLELREILNRIESRLPAVNYGMTFPLSAYSDYYAFYYQTLHPLQQPRLQANCAILIDATDWSSLHLERLLRSLDGQTQRAAAIFIFYSAGEAELEVRWCVEQCSRHGSSAHHIFFVGVSGNFIDQALNTIGEAAFKRLMWCRINVWFRPEAVELFDRALEDGANLVFGDSDTVVFDQAGREQHESPQFRTAFDYDLLLQQNYLDGPVAMDRDVLLGARSLICDTAHMPFILALHLREQEAESTIVHIPWILSHATPRGQPQLEEVMTRGTIVKAHLARIGVDADVRTHAEPARAVLSGTLRLINRSSQGERIAVIIPTRDRCDLIEPCITSISRSLRYNTSKVEIIVIDNQSRDPATLIYLSRLVGEQKIRVLPHDGLFNWALMNNRASAVTDAEVLVFLNNDTAVLSRDCWDELASHALRPEVGAVGARLLYEDGTIQHAGAVLDGWTSFSSHEGIGQRGDDPGYLGRNALLHKVSTVTGACLATRASLFRELGGFDANYLPIEGNDTDYCLKLESHGYAIIYNPYASFYHFESRSRGYNRDDRSRLQADEASRTLRNRWPERVDNDPYYNPHFDRLSPPCTRLKPPSMPTFTNSDKRATNKRANIE